MRSAAEVFPEAIAKLTAEKLELEERLRWRDDLIGDLVAENERLLREIAEAEAHQDAEILA